MSYLDAPGLLGGERPCGLPIPGSASTVLNALPLPHVYGNVVMNGTFMTGGTLAVMERFDPVAMLAAIGRHRVTVFDGVPTMYAMMLADPSLPGADLSSLRACSVGGQLPRSVLFVPDLPKTSTGKVMRGELRTLDA